MNYEVWLKPSVVKALDRLPGGIRGRVLARLDELHADPRPRGVEKLMGDDNLWRVRVGQYRIIYEINDDDRLLTVLRVAHRRDVYRGL